MREFVYDSVPGLEPEPEESDLAAAVELRNRVISLLNGIYPELNRNWQRDLPTDMGILEVMIEDLSLVFGIR